MLKKTLAVFLLIISLFSMTNIKAADSITVNAKAAVMIDANSGIVLYAKNKDARLGMASTTKIMTGILALEKGNLNDIYQVSPLGEWVEGSSLYLNPGEKISLATLLYGLLLKSGNDAALAIAIHIAGSEQAFVDMMNEKAQELGLANTHFANPHGLYAEDHYTSAHDLAILGAYAMKNPVFAQIVNTEKWQSKGLEMGDDRIINNANKLISLYPEAIGVKPGYTPETGRTLVGAAEKNGIRVITVTLDCSEDWNEHKKMFDYAFENYEKKVIFKKGESVGTYRVSEGNYNEVGVVTTEDVSTLVKKDESVNYEIELAPEKLTAPVMEGQMVGKAKLKFSDGTVHEVSLVTNGDVPVREKNFFKVIWQLFLAVFGVSV